MFSTSTKSLGSMSYPDDDDSVVQCRMVFSFLQNESWGTLHSPLSVTELIVHRLVDQDKTSKEISLEIVIVIINTRLFNSW